jgi:hypothetical protein
VFLGSLRVIRAPPALPLLSTLIPLLFHPLCDALLHTGLPSPKTTAMDFQLIAVLLYTVSAVLSAAVPACEDVETYIFKRQMNSNSTCTTYGVDYQDGGNYFINTNSNEAFTFVSGFQGCNNATAQLSLVNEDTGDQYDCGSVPTVPNNAPQTATCQVQKSQLTSGTYLIITIGNNGVGNPFADERQFMIEAGPQATITEYPTATTPVVATSCKSHRHSLTYITCLPFTSYDIRHPHFNSTEHFDYHRTPDNSNNNRAATSNNNSIRDPHPNSRDHNLRKPNHNSHSRANLSHSKAPMHLHVTKRTNYPKSWKSHSRSRTTL